MAKCSIHATGSWVIDDAAKVKINIHRMNVERLDSKSQGTFDFSSMYTTLDLQELARWHSMSNSSGTILQVHSREKGKFLILNVEPLNENGSVNC